uniref:CARD domain-containing protein n=1 Tax=Crocodylus porosus TaxID=8502 RepID=A0A7M4FW22_CROPO
MGENLSKVRTRFGESIDGGVIAPHLDDLPERRVLKQEEVENVWAERRRADQARYLMDGVRGKGITVSTIFIHWLPT